MEKKSFSGPPGSPKVTWDLSRAGSKLHSSQSNHLVPEWIRGLLSSQEEKKEGIRSLSFIYLFIYFFAK